MPRISTFMYCEQAEINQHNQKLNISGPLHVIITPFIPTNFSFSIVFGLMAFNNEQDNGLQIRFLDSDGNILVDANNITIGKNMDPQTMALPPEARGLIANLDFRNVTLRKPGVYVTQILLNQDLLGEFPIQVVQAGEIS